MLKIIIEDLRLYGFHGVHAHEKENGQFFIFHVEIVLYKSSMENDDIGKTVNYSDVIKLLKKINKENKYDLLETLSEIIAKRILNTFGMAKDVIVRVKKESPPIKEDIKSVGVEFRISRSCLREDIAYLSLGSNIGDRQKNILRALSLIGQESNIKILKSSSIYETEPMYYKEQPSFYNSVLKISVSGEINPFVLLGILKHIEYVMGRDEKVERNGPRIIDIDILFYGDYRIDTVILKIPHPKIGERNFVLKPIAEIDASFLIGNMTIKDFLNKKTFDEKVKKVLEVKSFFT
jgi:dihydroneopterin aldolase / 2-amino-4-hydroxy-6-hydroxymethyldihydropteridine diphosphokinase